MKRLQLCLVGCLCATTVVSGQARRETPVGVVLSPAGAKLIPAGAETPLAAKAADLLFAGDVLQSGSAPATFLYCPAKISQSLAPSSEILLQSAQIKVKSGKVSEVAKINSCFLPSVLHVATASQQHYGASMVRALTKGDESKPLPPDKLDAATTAELAPFDAALKADPNDPTAHIGRGAVFEAHKLLANALEEYKTLGASFADAVWIKGKLFELQEAIALAAVATPATTGGQTFALLIGVSQYQKLPKESWLQYANADALAFAQYLSSPRGGSVPAANIVTLIDANATTAAVRNAFQTFLKAKAGKKDSVIILIAGHGTVETPGNKGAFIVTHDADPQDLAATGLPMVEIQDLIQNELSRVGRVILLADVCRAGSIGSIRSTTVNSAIERLGEADGEILGLLASRPKELSHEGDQFGGGHGAFTYYVLKALTGAADKNHDNIVDVNEVIEYVRREVAQATGDKQHPRDFGTAGNDVPLADVSKPGIPVAKLAPSRWPALLDTKGAPIWVAQAGRPSQTGGSAEFSRFEDALRAGRLLPGSPENAFDALAPLATRLGPSDFLDRQNQLRIALENRGQQVLLRYLEGDEHPQSEVDFDTGARYFEAALQLTPESIYLQARAAFCRGRALIFRKRYADAAELLERSVRLDPSGAYAYNGLGIAYLEQGRYDQAGAALRDAIRRAPQWTYPLHNLALTMTQAGDYSSAIRNYEKAIRLTPQFAYLRYNLGTVYQNLNRKTDAQLAYRQAIERSPNLADAYNAIGSLYAAEHKTRQAEENYRRAITMDPDLLAARHNLALLLSAQQPRRTEAIELWRENLRRSPQYLASRLSLAEALAGSGDPDQAIAQYREALQQKPEYVGARLALAELLEKTHQPSAALTELELASKQTPNNPAILERIGDLQLAAQHPAEAKRAFEAAADASTEGRERKRLRTKAGSL